MANALATTATKNAQPATADAQPKTFRDLITTASYRSELAKALPHGVDVDRVTKVVLTAINKSPDLLSCTAKSMYQAVVECATLNLWPGPQGHAYLIRYNNKVKENGQERWEAQAQFMLGYRGMIDLAYRSGAIVPGTFSAQPVYERDAFDYEYGSNPRIMHRPALSGDRGALLGFYVCCQPKDGPVVFDVMRKDEVDAIRARSKSPDKGPWATDYNAMGMKTVIRRFWKKLPSSVVEKFADALERDMEQEFDLAKEAEATVVPDAKPAKVRGEAAPASDTPPPEDVAPEPEPEAPAEAQAPPPTATQATATEFAKRVIQDLGDELAGDIIGKALAAVGAGTVKQLQPAQCGPFLAKLTGLYDVARGAA